MTEPDLTVTVLHAAAEPARVIVLMPGLGTAVAGTWDRTAGHFSEDSQIIAVDLPGHGRSPAWEAAGAQASIAGLAQAVASTVTAELQRVGLQHLPVHFAGISLAGAVALQIAWKHSATFASAAVVCSAAKIGQSATWTERAAAVRAEGTKQLVEGSVARWFAPGFPSREPDAVELLCRTLIEADSESYALLCETLSTFDLTDQLGEIKAPVLVIAGEHDAVTTPDDAATITSGIENSALHVLTDTAHQAPTEQPAEV